MKIRNERAIHPSVQRLYKLVKDKYGAEGPSAVADVVLQSTQVLQNWARGRGVSKPGALEIERTLGLSAKYIREGTGPAYVEKNGAHHITPSTIVPPRLVRRVPIVGQLRYEGERGGFVYHENEQHTDHIAAFTNGEHGCAYTVRNDKFAPRYRAGEHVVTAPRLDPEPGDDVLLFFKKEPGRFELVRLIRLGDDVEVQDLATNAPRTHERQAIVIEKVIGCYSNFAKLSGD